MRRVLVAAVALAMATSPLSTEAQTAGEQLQHAIDAYRGLELDAAAGFLRRALAFPPGQGLSPLEYARGLSFLGAVELFRQRHDSAVAAFRRLILLDPRYQPDALIFPPPVLRVFDEVRRRTKVVRVVAPAEAEIRVHEDMFTVRLYASSYHEVASAVARDDGTLFRRLYSGEIVDSLDLRWDGLDSAGLPAVSGKYYLKVESHDRDGSVLRVVQLPMEVESLRRDTLVHPSRPADSALLPERQPSGPALRAIAAGAVLGSLAVGLPFIVGGEEEASGTRFAVGGALTFAALIGVFTRIPGRPLPQNIAANQALLDQWVQQTDATIRENLRRMQEHRLRIRTGPSMRSDPD